MYSIFSWGESKAVQNNNDVKTTESSFFDIIISNNKLHNIIYKYEYNIHVKISGV